MIIDELFEGPQLCPECGGISFSDLILAEKKDACYYKVKASAKVWPSAYASGRLVQCRKKGAANYGKSKTESIRDPNEMSGVNSMRKKLGNIIKQAAQDDEVAYNASKLYRELWNIYGGDIDAIIAERSIFELEKLARELVAVSKQGMAEGIDTEEFANEVYAEFERIYPNLARRADERTIHSAIMDVLNYGGDNNAGALAQDVARAVKQQMQQGMAEQQELDEKWSQKYKKSINCANPRGFSQRAHCAGRKKNEDVAEGVMYGAENLHVGDDVVVSGDVNFKGATGVINSFGQDKRFVVVDLYNHGRHSFHSSDVSANDYDNDEHDDLDEGGDVFMPNIKDTAEYKAGLATGKLPVPYPEGTQQYASYYKGVIDRASPTLAKVGEEVQATDDGAFSTWNGGMRVSGPTAYEKARQLDPDSFAEGEQQKGADYRAPKEVDYDDEYDAMVARVKKLAGLGPMKTVYDPAKRVYRNIPTAVQPKK